jgi:hypothetical protein
MVVTGPGPAAGEVIGHSVIGHPGASAENADTRTGSTDTRPQSLSQSRDPFEAVGLHRHVAPDESAQDGAEHRCERTALLDREGYRHGAVGRRFQVCPAGVRNPGPRDRQVKLA